MCEAAQIARGAIRSADEIGMNPRFWSYAKLKLCQITCVDPFDLARPMGVGFRLVEVMANVVAKSIRSDCMVYGLDDGSALLSMTQWTVDSDGTSLQDLLVADLGDLVRAKVQPRMYLGRMELLCKSISRVTDENEEMLFWLDAAMQHETFRFERELYFPHGSEGRLRRPLTVTPCSCEERGVAFWDRDAASGESSAPGAALGLCGCRFGRRGAQALLEQYGTFRREEASAALFDRLDYRSACAGAFLVSLLRHLHDEEARLLSAGALSPEKNAAPFGENALSEEQCRGFGAVDRRLFAYRFRFSELQDAPGLRAAAERAAAGMWRERFLAGTAPAEAVERMEREVKEHSASGLLSRAVAVLRQEGLLVLEDEDRDSYALLSSRTVLRPLLVREWRYSKADEHEGMSENEVEATVLQLKRRHMGLKEVPLPRWIAAAHALVTDAAFVEAEAALRERSAAKKAPADAAEERIAKKRRPEDEADAKENALPARQGAG